MFVCLAKPVFYILYLNQHPSQAKPTHYLTSKLQHLLIYIIYNILTQYELLCYCQVIECKLLGHEIEDYLQLNIYPSMLPMG